LNPKNHKKDAKKNNLLGTNLGNQVESNLDVDENIFCTSVKKDVNLSILHHKEDKEMTKLFHIKIQVKNTKVYSLFDFGSHDNLIVDDLIRNLRLEVHGHLSPYTLG
jgi:hypothetical protein